MKKLTTCFVFILAISSISAQNRLQIQAASQENFVSISRIAAGKLKIQELPYQLKYEGGRITANSGFSLIRLRLASSDRKVFLLSKSSEASRLTSNLAGKHLPASFTAMGSGRLGTNDGDWFLFCSCGSNVTKKSGDDCGPWPADGGLMACSGTCSGESAGKTCSFTGLHFMDNGETRVVSL